MESDHDVVQQAQKLGLEVMPLSMVTTKYEQLLTLILGFAGCNPEKLRRGVSVLATFVFALVRLNSKRLQLSKAGVAHS